MAATDLFLVTSVIHTGHAPWSYSLVRSCFSPEQRFEQTLKTIESIRQYHSSSRILLIEASTLDAAMTTQIQEKVDYFVQVDKNDEIHKICLESNNKGYGEATLLAAACAYIKENAVPFSRLFKLSGRYKLNSNFQEGRFNTLDAFTFKMVHSENGSTVLYTIPYPLFDTFIENVEYCIQWYKHNGPRGIETLLPCICTPRQEIDMLGVWGQVAVDREILEG